jgi:hypothetical protein
MKLVVNSMNVFEFDADGKVIHLDVFLQQPPPRPDSHRRLTLKVEAILCAAG